MVYGIIFTVLQCLESVFFFDICMKRKDSFSDFPFIVLPFGFLFGLLLNLPIYTSKASIIAISVLGFFILSSILYRASFVHRIVFVLAFYAVLNSIEAATTSVLLRLLGISPNAIYSSVLLLWGIALFEFFVIWLLTQCIRLLKKDIALEKYALKWNIVPISIYCTTLILVFYLLCALQQGAVQVQVVIICTSLLVFISTLVLFVIDRIHKNVNKQQETLSLYKQLHSQAESIEALSQAYTSQRKMTHEYNAHLLALSGYLNQGDIVHAKEYLSNQLKVQNTRILTVNTHNPVLDAIFNQKALSAQKANIDLLFKFNNLADVKISTSDLAVIIGNLMDNAIEACAKLPKENRVIEVHAILDDTFTFSVRNHSVPVSIQNGHIASTKGDQTLHGFGLANVQSILALYPDSFSSMKYEDGWFYYTLELPNIVR